METSMPDKWMDSLSIDEQKILLYASCCTLDQIKIDLETHLYNLAENILSDMDCKINNFENDPLTEILDKIPNKVLPIIWSSLCQYMRDVDTPIKNLSGDDLQKLNDIRNYLSQLECDTAEKIGL